ncbi:MAG: ThuA domain-containing protein [Fimbriimonas sp.]|nr:ThuA domain-containing protein [Fimbriimonas sp.]
MSFRVLFVGGCPAPFHRLEPAEPFVRAAAEVAGFHLDVSGVFHPDGSEAHSGDYSSLNAETLAGYDGVILFTTGNEQGADIAALLEFVRSGKALIGIHCATDSFTSNKEFIAAIGGKFRTHPAPLDVAVEFVDALHPITKGLAPFTVLDELYLFSDYDPARVHLLAETNSYSGEAHVPVCWTRDEGEGRVFYLSLGHMPEAMASPGWQSLFQRGVRWALRDLE